jgi:hypothetical protein
MPDLEAALTAFLARCDQLADRRRWRRSTLSTRLFNDGGKLDQIVAGRDIGVRRLARAVVDLQALEETPAEQVA